MTTFSSTALNTCKQTLVALSDTGHVSGCQTNTCHALKSSSSHMERDLNHLCKVNGHIHLNFE